MVNIGDLLSLDRVADQREITSKKRVLETLAEMIAGATMLGPTEVFDCLLTRERLGSTGLGRGVALPHGRMQGLKSTVGALLRLQTGIDFDAPDDKPVDLFFALGVPQECTETHLQILAQLAELFADPVMLERMRSARDSTTLLALLRDWQPD